MTMCIFLSSGIFGTLFVNEKEIAYTIFVIGVALGFTISFIIAIFLSPVAQLWIILCIVAISGITYTILIISMKVLGQNNDNDTTIDAKQDSIYENSEKENDNSEKDENSEKECKNSEKEDKM